MKLESRTRNRVKYYSGGGSRRWKDMSVRGESDMMKMFVPLAQDRMWLLVWLELEGHFAIVEGPGLRWVMTSSRSQTLWLHRGLHLKGLRIPPQPCSRQSCELDMRGLGGWGLIWEKTTWERIKTATIWVTRQACWEGLMKPSSSRPN